MRSALAKRKHLWGRCFRRETFPQVENLAREGEYEKNNKKRRSNYIALVFHNPAELSADIWVLISLYGSPPSTNYSYSQLSTELWSLIHNFCLFLAVQIVR
jgi:hypothetical protein